MTWALRDAGLGVQIVAYAYLALLIGALVLMAGAPIAARLTGSGGRIPNPVEALMGVGVVIGFPGAMAAGMAMIVSPLLVAMPLPLAGWVLIGGLSLYGAYDAKVHPGSGMDGCAKLFIAAFSGFGLCWAGAAILLAAPPAGNAASFVRPILVAAPLAIFLGKHSRRNEVKKAIGFGLFLAVFVAVAFLPVEQGFASSRLPASDWLRFPMMGALVFGAWPLLAIPLGLLFGKRAVNLGKTGRMVGALGLVGGLFGLVWAITRLLF